MRKKSIGRFAALKGDLELVQWSIEQAGCPKDTYLFIYAAQSGNLALMIWLQQNDCPMSGAIYEAASEFGHLEILKWALENNCPFVKSTWGLAAHYAVLSDHDAIFYWLFESSYLWSSNFDSENNLSWCCEIAATCAQKNRLDLLRYIKRILPNLQFDYRVIEAAAELNSLEILKWLEGIMEPHYFRDHLDIASWRAARFGHLATLKWMRKRNCLFDQLTWSNAAFHGDLSILEWAVKQKFKIDYQQILGKAACEGQLPIISWAIEYGAKPNEEIVYSAVQKGKIEIFEFCRQNHFPFPKDSQLYNTAMHNGKLKMLKYLFACGYQWSEETSKYGWGWDNYLSILQWLHEVGCTIRWDFVFKKAMIDLSTSRKIFRWARQFTNFDNAPGLCRQAASCGNLKLLIYLDEQGCPWDEATLRNIAGNEQPHIVNWISSKMSQVK